MSRSAERAFRSVERIFRSAEYTFRSAEHRTKTYSDIIMTALVNTF